MLARSIVAGSSVIHFVVLRKTLHTVRKLKTIEVYLLFSQINAYLINHAYIMVVIPYKISETTAVDAVYCSAEQHNTTRHK